MLMLDYYLRPEQAVEARLTGDGLVAGSFAHPVPVAPGDSGAHQVAPRLRAVSVAAP
ncbi:MAG: hypothetical protein M0T79_04735 [Actinomycetota bacterium]|nr:hypothetical protein [Actinomycetota bacterium]